ncbi:MAG: hypothetical protein IPM82_22295 [Saprospiraceae bacterium]|nr:hypothetical protein [Saprospiraceae bacterium]
MSNKDFLYAIADAENLMKGFTECTLPKEEWTHESHLIAGLWLLARHGEKALPEMRTRLLRYNESVGGVNDDHNGYHETMTVFWLWAIRELFADDNGKVYWSQDALDDLIFDETLADRNLWTEFYSKEKMMSVEARGGYVPPDLKEME